MATMTKAERAFAEGMSSVELSARTTGPKNARVLTVYIEADNRYQIEDTGYSLANVLAHKRGFSVSNDVTVTPIRRATCGRYQAKIEYADRWRGRSL
jgi:hypothetical protein